MDAWDDAARKIAEMDDELQRMRHDLNGLDGPKIKTDILQLFKVTANIVPKDMFDALKGDITKIKQEQSSQRLQFEQFSNDLKNRLVARENTITELHNKLAEKEKMLSQFRRLNGDVNLSSSNNTHSQLTAVATGEDKTHQIPPSSGRISVNRHHLSRTSTAEPPLKGLLMQREATHAAQQQRLMQRRGPNIPDATGGRVETMNFSGSMLTRPFSTNSNGSGSNSSTSRVRDLSHGSGYIFSGSTNSQRLNKRRRSGTPNSQHYMSPSTALTLNQGPHSHTGRQPWIQRDSGGYP